jgi:hypothetical protein
VVWPSPLQANPLVGVSQVDRKSTGIDKYFIKVVGWELAGSGASDWLCTAYRGLWRIACSSQTARQPALPPTSASACVQLWAACPAASAHQRCPPLARAPPPPQVPTDYYSLWGWRTHSYQYSVTEYYHRFQGGEDHPPGVYLL